jgi:phosphoadenosine phosphosulfate reductase
MDWRAAEVWRYVREDDVPYHALHNDGYDSIGCAP